MKKNLRNTIALAAVMALLLTGCGTVAANTGSNTKTGNSVSTSADTDNGGAAVALSNTAVSDDDAFTARDLAQTADLSDAKYLTVSDSSTLEITEAGVYVLSGTAANCTVTVNVSKEDKVQLVLDGVTVTNSDFPAIYVISADKVFITTAEDSDNALTVSGSFRADGDTNTDAVIFSKDDLVLNGTGSLRIVSAQGNGITSKDDLKVTGGTYSIQSALDAIEANDAIAVSDGSFTIQSGKDGLHCENDSAEGTITISGGTFDINVKSDAIQATALLQIDGGTFNISASEGLEATYVQINDGDITISASDDGINASRKSTAYDVVIEINGGNLNITMGQGDTDAIDANGSIYVNGGTINITAPTSSFDYDVSAELNGGTVIINGEQVSEIPAGMMGGFGGGMMGGRGGQSGGNQGGFGGRGGRSNGQQNGGQDFFSGLSGSNLTM